MDVEGKMSERATNRLLAWTTARRPAFPEATAWDWGLYRDAKYFLILLHPPVQRESAKGVTIDVEGKMSERATADKPLGARQPTRTLGGITRLVRHGFPPSFFVLLAPVTYLMNS